MSRWFRVYSNLVDDPKFIKLGPDLRSALLMMWCVASGNDGRLPGLEDIAIKFRLSLTRTKRLLDELRRCGFVDDDEAGSTPHNWNARQFKSDVSNERVKRHRKQKCNVTETADVTPPDTEADTEADTEKKDSRAFALADGWPADAFDQFWAEYPTKIAKKAAIRAFAAAKRSRVPFERLMFGLARYKSEKPPQIEWCHPATWLNGGRWDDQPAPSIQGTQNVAENRSLAGALDRAAEYFSRADGVGDEAGAPVLRLISQG